MHSTFSIDTTAVQPALLHRYVVLTCRNTQSIHAFRHPLLERAEENHDKGSQFLHVGFLGRDNFISDLCGHEKRKHAPYTRRLNVTSDYAFAAMKEDKSGACETLLCIANRR